MIHDAIQYSPYVHAIPSFSVHVHVHTTIEVFCSDFVIYSDCLFLFLARLELPCHTLHFALTDVYVLVGYGVCFHKRQEFTILLRFSLILFIQLEVEVFWNMTPSIRLGEFHQVKHGHTKIILIFRLRLPTLLEYNQMSMNLLTDNHSNSYSIMEWLVWS